MKIEQVYEFVNDAQKEVLGESAIILNKDLTNIVDVGTSLENAQGIEPFYKAMANRIGKMLFVSRAYTGRLPSILKDAWEFGSIVGKVQADLIEAQENEAWKIVNGASYDPYVVNLPVISSKFYNQMSTFELDITYPEDQIKQSFKSADEMVRFTSMLETMVNNSMELKIDTLVHATLCNFIGGLTIDEQDNGASARVVHLLTTYNTLKGTSLTPEKALIDKGFLQYATAEMILAKSRIANYSKAFNVGHKARHTPADLLHIVVLDAFASKAKTHLESDTFHNEFVKLPKYEEVSYWQGSGTTFALADVSRVAGEISYTTEQDGAIETTTDNVNQPYVIAVMFDNDALGVLQPQRKVKTAYNPKGEYFNEFHKWNSRYFNDFNENAIVFLLN